MSCKVLYLYNVTGIKMCAHAYMLLQLGNVIEYRLDQAQLNGCIGM